ncbi:hypothetical protein DOT_0711 [Desulfosporosinus sp. OT]|nr:hypothetical protein DOT_0711 [Desulfosporosinus sp. OT]
MLARGDEALDAVIRERQSFLGAVLKDYTDEEYEDLLSRLELLTQRMELK